MGRFANNSLIHVATSTKNLAMNSDNIEVFFRSDRKREGSTRRLRAGRTGANNIRVLTGLRQNPNKSANNERSRGSTHSRLRFRQSGIVQFSQKFKDSIYSDCLQDACRIWQALFHALDKIFWNKERQFHTSENTMRSDADCATMSGTGMFSPRISVRNSALWLMVVVLLALGALAVLRPHQYLFLFGSKMVFLLVWFLGVVLLYFVYRE
jgi:hypothetical protein